MDLEGALVSVSMSPSPHNSSGEREKKKTKTKTKKYKEIKKKPLNQYDQRKYINRPKLVIFQEDNPL